MKLWILLSFLAAITTSFRIFGHKYISNTNYDNITIILFSLFFITTLVAESGDVIFPKKKNIKKKNKKI